MKMDEVEPTKRGKKTQEQLMPPLRSPIKMKPESWGVVSYDRVIQELD